MCTACVIYGKLSKPYIKKLNFLTHKLSRSQLFEGTAFCLTSCCRLYALLVQFVNNIYRVEQSLNRPECSRRLRLLGFEKSGA